MMKDGWTPVIFYFCLNFEKELPWRDRSNTVFPYSLYQSGCILNKNSLLFILTSLWLGLLTTILYLNPFFLSWYNLSIKFPAAQVILTPPHYFSINDLYSLFHQTRIRTQTLWSLPIFFRYLKFPNQFHLFFPYMSACSPFCSQPILFRWLPSYKSQLS